MERHIRIGLQLKIARVENELNMAELAKRSGVARSHICEIESGKKNPTAVTIRKLADPLGYDFGLIKKEG